MAAHPVTRAIPAVQVAPGVQVVQVVSTHQAAQVVSMDSAAPVIRAGRAVSVRLAAQVGSAHPVVVGRLVSGARPRRAVARPRFLG